MPIVAGNSGLQSREIYQEEEDKKQTDDDIKNLCTSQGGIALWRPKRTERGRADLDSPGEIQDVDVAMTQGAAYNWLYGARLAALRAIGHVSVDRLRF